ncbi:hypothetical protein C0992_007842 [Termitomyces sp. T32_za158]|nr:hypothetical protein C0992_007842 [Termitomyces sp. T32_za158]
MKPDEREIIKALGVLLVDLFRDIVVDALYPIIVGTLIQGPSVMLGMHETASSIHEAQIDVNITI